jgi:hypothetical protein
MFSYIFHRSSSGARSMTMMPIGIPKVAYKMPGNRGGEWVDIFNRLTRERIIFMGSEIDDELANQIIGVLLVSKYRPALTLFIPSHLDDFHSTWITRTPVSPSTCISIAPVARLFLDSQFMTPSNIFDRKLSLSTWAWLLRWHPSFCAPVLEDVDSLCLTRA